MTSIFSAEIIHAWSPLSSGFSAMVRYLHLCLEALGSNQSPCKKAKKRLPRNSLPQTQNMWELSALDTPFYLHCRSVVTGTHPCITAAQNGIVWNTLFRAFSYYYNPDRPHEIPALIMWPALHILQRTWENFS